MKSSKIFGTITLLAVLIGCASTLKVKSDDPYNGGLQPGAPGLQVHRAVTAPKTTTATTQPGTGVWYQPPSLFSKWKDRGITVLWGCAGNAEGTPDAWVATAKLQGFQLVLQGDGTLEKYYADSAVIAVAMRDEPNIKSITPGQCQDEYVALRRKTTKPIFLNLSGYGLIEHPDDVALAAYLRACDWMGFDAHVLNMGYGPEGISVIGDLCDKFKSLAPGKPLVVVMETSDQQLYLQSWLAGTPRGLRARGPTAKEVQDEINIAYAHGADRVVCFPDVIGLGWVSFDGTTDSVSGALSTLGRK